MYSLPSTSSRRAPQPLRKYSGTGALTRQGLGGGGYILVRMADGRTTFFDFREQAPGRASRNMFLDAAGNLTKDSVIGWKAAAVPGTVKGYETAHRKFGTKPWAELVQPAIRLAADG